MNKWKRYFERLLNEKFSNEEVDQCGLNLGMVSLIREEEVWRAIRKMIKRKAVGPDGIPVEAWKVLEALGVHWLIKFFNRLLVGGKIPDSWRKSYIIPISKRKRRCTGLWKL